MTLWRDVQKDPPKPGAVIVAKGEINTIIGKVVDRKAGGLRYGQLCIEGIWLNTGNHVVRMLQEAVEWVPAGELVDTIQAKEEST